jgi:hypothetical protein
MILSELQVNQLIEIINDYEDISISSVSELYSKINDLCAKVHTSDPNILDFQFWHKFREIQKQYDLPFPAESKGVLLDLISNLSIDNRNLNYQLKKEKANINAKIRNFKEFLYFLSECCDNTGLTHAERNGIMQLMKRKIEAFDYFLQDDGEF